jgi:hypothetical protein
METPESDSDSDMSEGNDYTKTLGTRVTSDTKQRFDNYAEREGVRKSEALRRFVHSGLDNADTEASILTDRLAPAALALLVVGYPTYAAYIDRPFAAAGWIVLLVAYILFQPEIKTAAGRLPNPLE